MRLHRHLLILVCSITTMLSLSCSSPPDPEVIVTEFIEQAESAFENRRIRALRNLISREYQDSQKRDDNEIIAIGSSYIMRSKFIHLFADPESASFAGDKVQATVLVAFAARPVADRNLLVLMKADIYWFEILLTQEDGDWKMVSSEWRQAMLEDILN